MTVVTPSAAHEADGLTDRHRHWAVASALAAMTLVVLDAAMVNAALPTIGKSLHAEPARAVGVVTAYQLGLVAMLLPAAALGQRLGYWQVFTAGVSLFTLASTLCALSPSLPWLLAGRVLQGVGGAGVMALGVALLRHSVPHDRLGEAIGWNALVVALSSAAGPAVGAMVLSCASWPWIFAVNVPIGLVVLAAARALPRVVGDGRPSPLMPFDLLRMRPFGVSVAASILCFAGQSAGLVALPFHLQHAYSLTPIATGLYLMAWPLAVAVAGPIAGRFAGHFSTERLCLIGGFLLAVGLASAAAWPSGARPEGLACCAVVCGLGFGLFNVANNRSMFLSAPRARSAAAGALQGLARLTGQACGAIAMAWMFRQTSLDVAPRAGFAAGAILTLMAGVVSMLRTERRGRR